MSAARLAISYDDLPPAALAAASAVLKAGELLLLPTETVYGVAAQADRPAAVRRLAEAKGRDGDKPLQTLVADGERARRLAGLWPPRAARWAAAFWPGPLTLVVPAASGVPPTLCASDGTIGLRCPACPAVQRLLELSGPLAASSANRAGEPPALDCAEALAALGAMVALALDAGPVPGGTASTVVRLEADGYRILRPGALTAAELAAHA